MKRIYFEYDQLDPFVEWFLTEPAGEWQILIGNTVDNDLAWIVGSVAGLGSWALAEGLVAKMQAGEITIEARPETAEMPVGVAME